MSLETLAVISTVGIYIFVFLCGACIGSFLNVCILRLPAGESLIKKNSHCMTCGAEIKRYDLIPIFSYLFLRGKCRNCGAKISPRYCIVESLTALLFTAVFIRLDVIYYGFVFPAITCLFIAALIVICFEDLDTQSMSVSVLVWMSVFAAAQTLLCIFGSRAKYITEVTGVTFSDRIIGVFAVSVPLLLIGFVITPLAYSCLLSDDHRERRKLKRRLQSELSPFDLAKVQSAFDSVDSLIRERGNVYGFGMGDVVLMAAAGLMLGYRAVIVAAFIGIVIGALYGIYLKHRENDGEDSGKFAFGPFLCIGIAAAVFAGNIIWNAYMGLIR